MKILIAEDVRASAKMLEINLRNNGYTSFIARNGREAIECLQSMPDIELVITDIMMPKMDGLELLRTTKEHDEWKEIPVIMSTVMADLETVKKAAGMGCRDYLAKPVSAAQLIQKVRKALGDKKVILQNRSKIMSDMGMDSKSYENVVKAFLDRLDKKIDNLEAQLKTQDPQLTPNDLGGLAEGAKLLGADRVTDLLHKLGSEGGKEEAEALHPPYNLLLRELKALRIALTSSI